MLNSTKKSKQIGETPTRSGKNQTTKKLFTCLPVGTAFILLMGGMFSFSIADAQWICDCVPGHPAGYCYVDSHGNTKCQKIHVGHGGTWRLDQNESDMGVNTSLQVYPNPVSTSTAISFSLVKSQNVSIRIFDMNGRVVTTLADKFFEEGDYEIVWNATDANAGVYFLQMVTGSYTENQKLIVAK